MHSLWFLLYHYLSLEDVFRVSSTCQDARYAFNIFMTTYYQHINVWRADVSHRIMKWRCFVSTNPPMKTNAPYPNAFEAPDTVSPRIEPLPRQPTLREAPKNFIPSHEWKAFNQHFRRWRKKHRKYFQANMEKIERDFRLQYHLN